MKQIGNGKFAPTTFKVGLLEKPLTVVLPAFLEWHRRLYRVVESHAATGVFEQELTRLLPLVLPPRRTLWWSTDSKWTACFDNSALGSDPLSTISYLAEQIQCRGLIATCVPHTLDSDTGHEEGTYGAVQFELFAPAPTDFLNYERSISVAYESGWGFGADGKVQSFEEVSAYSAPKVVDRFTPEMLDRYCRALGVRLFDETFYSGPGALVVVADPVMK